MFDARGGVGLMVLSVVAWFLAGPLGRAHAFWLSVDAEWLVRCYRGSAITMGVFGVFVLVAGILQAIAG